MNEDTNKRASKSWKDFFKLGEVGGYFFRAKDPNRPVNTSLKMMHGVNKISMLMFLACVVIIIVRILMRKFS
jgi:hypothetical protein